MEYTLFSEAETGTTLSRPVLITGITESKARNGSTYLRITMKDQKSEQTVMMFNMTAERLDEEKGVIKGCIADAQLDVSQYNGAKSFTVKEISLCTDQSVTAADFVRMPPADVNKMYDEICGMLRRVADNRDGKYVPLSELALSILNGLRKEYITSSAAIAMHHNLRGGLIYHSYRMAKAADSLCDVYDILDRELMVCGAVLHDIGKIWEYNTSETGEAEYSSEGVLSGHLYLGASYIERCADGSGCDPEKVKMLVHMILSHHGTQEWGAVACPATAEAMALHYIDNMDAKLYAIEEQYQQIAAGTFTEKRPFGFDNRIYRPNL